MKSRDLKFLLLSIVMSLMVIIAFPQSSARAQDCFDENKKPIECPTKEPPKDPGNPLPPSDSKKNNKPGSSNSVIVNTLTYTPTATDTPKPTDTKIPTATATKPVDCECANSIPGTDPQRASSDLAPVANPDPLVPWLMGGSGVLIGLILGVLAGSVIFGRRRSLTARGSGISQMGESGPSRGEDESTRFVKITEAGVVDFSPPLSTANQVSEVRVRAWDPVHKKEIVGSARSSSTLGDTKETPPHPKSEGHLKHDADAIKDAELEIHSEEIHFKKADD
jgi:hypothetical protein